MTTSTSIHPDYITGTWKLDPSHSEVSFTVKHLMISKVRGVFETLGLLRVSVTPRFRPLLRPVWS